MSGPDRVLGIGSPHGDDAVGWLLIDRLRQRGVAADLAAIHPWQLLDPGPSCRRWILVDAFLAGEVPGTLLRLEWPAARLADQVHFSSHGIGLVDAMQLAGALGRLPPQVVILGVQAAAADVWQQRNAGWADTAFRDSSVSADRLLRCPCSTAGFHVGRALRDRQRVERPVHASDFAKPPARMEVVLGECERLPPLAFCGLSPPLADALPELEQLVIDELASPSQRPAARGSAAVLAGSSSSGDAAR